MTQRIVVLDAISEDVAQRLRALLPQNFELLHASSRDETHLEDLISDADYAISGQVPVPGTLLRAAPELKLLHKWGVGVDNFDLDAARELGVKVARTTGSNAVAVAEFTVGLMIGSLRHLAHGHHNLQSGHWRNWRGRDPFLLSDKRVGLVGFGAIGKQVAKLLTGFNCDTYYYKPSRLTAGEEQSAHARYAPLDELLAHSDVVSLHCPLTEQTHNLIDRSALERMKTTATLINVARGEVVDVNDLVWALGNGVIHSAAVDVYEVEPLPADSPMIGIDNLTLTPHLGAMARDTFEPTVSRMFRNIELIANGERVPKLDSVLD